MLSNTNETSIQFNLEMNKKSLLNDSGSIKTLIVFRDVLKLYETLARILKRQHKAQNSWENF